MRKLVPSGHFIERLARRHLSPQDIAFVLEHGRTFYRTGIEFHFLGRKDIPEHLQREPRISRLEGITVLLSHTGVLVTAYKNPRSLRQIKRKSKLRWPAYPAHRSGRVSRPFSHASEGLEHKAETEVSRGRR